MLDLIIKNGKCYINGELNDVDVAIKDGKIKEIGQIQDDSKEIVNAKYPIIILGHEILNLQSAKFIFEGFQNFLKDPHVFLLQ